MLDLRPSIMARKDSRGIGEASKALTLPLGAQCRLCQGANSKDSGTHAIPHWTPNKYVPGASTNMYKVFLNPHGASNLDDSGEQGLR